MVNYIQIYIVLYKRGEKFLQAKNKNMENTRISLFKRLSDFFISFTGDSSDNVITEGALTAEEKKELASVIKAESGNVGKIENMMRGNIKAKTDSKAAIKAATEKAANKAKTKEIEDKTK